MRINLENAKVIKTVKGFGGSADRGGAGKYNIQFIEIAANRC